MHMPRFSFEKIPPPVSRGSSPPIANKPRGVISQILDRLVEARVKRRLSGKGGIAERPQKRS
jgi:hypothetical protein